MYRFKVSLGLRIAEVALGHNLLTWRPALLITY